MAGAPDYYKSILLYGLYEGAPVPLACDAQGRLILVAESVSPFGKAGTIVLQDTFEEGLVRAAVTETGTGASVSVDSIEAAEGGHSCKLIAGSDGARQARLEYTFQPTQLNKLGIDFGIRFGANVQEFKVQPTAYDGEFFYSGLIRYVPADDRWEVYEYATSTWQVLLDHVAYSATAHHFLRFKLVIDIPNQCHLSFRHTGGVVDISAYPLYVASSISYQRAYAYFQVTSDPATNGVVYLDNITLTQDES